jgi:hypothetical protein
MLLSIAIEVPVAVAICLYGRFTRDWERLLLVGVATTLVTHPLAWPAYREWLVAIPSWPRLLLVEIGVSLVESALYGGFAGLGVRRGLLVGFGTNFASAGFGVAVQLMRQAGH